MDTVTWTVTEVSPIGVDAATEEQHDDCGAENEVISGDVDRLLEAEVEDVASSCTAKELQRIIAYHGIAKTGRRKTDMARAVVLFEADPANYSDVQERVRLLANLEELSRDPYFCRYVSF